MRPNFALAIVFALIGMLPISASGSSGMLSAPCFRGLDVGSGVLVTDPSGQPVLTLVSKSAIWKQYGGVWCLVFSQMWAYSVTYQLCDGSDSITVFQGYVIEEYENNKWCPPAGTLPGASVPIGQGVWFEGQPISNPVATPGGVPPAAPGIGPPNCFAESLGFGPGVGIPIPAGMPGVAASPTNGPPVTVTGKDDIWIDNPIPILGQGGWSISACFLAGLLPPVFLTASQSADICEDCDMLVLMVKREGEEPTAEHAANTNHDGTFDVKYGGGMKRDGVTFDEAFGGYLANLPPKSKYYYACFSYQ